MKEYHYYECSYCGERFGEEYDCQRHELMVHKVQPCKSLILLNALGVPMEVKFDSLDYAYYIIWTNDEGLAILQEWANCYYGHSSHSFSGYYKSTGRLYLETISDDWHDFIDLEGTYLEIRDVFAQYPLDKFNQV